MIAQPSTLTRTERHSARLSIACVLLLALTLTACQSPESVKLQGAWELVDSVDLASRINQAAPAVANPAHNGEGSSNRMEVVFAPSGSLQTRTRMGDMVREKSGTWRLLANRSDSERSLVAYTLEADQGELEIEWIDEATIKMVPPNMAGLTMKLVFRRRMDSGR